MVVFVGANTLDVVVEFWFDRRGQLNVAGLNTTGEDVWEYQGVILRLAP